MGCATVAAVAGRKGVFMYGFERKYRPLTKISIVNTTHVHNILITCIYTKKRTQNSDLPLDLFSSDLARVIQ